MQEPAKGFFAVVRMRQKHFLPASDKPYEIEPFERICQMVIAPVVPCNVEEVTELGNTERGEGGFGSTGKK